MAEPEIPGIVEEILEEANRQVAACAQTPLFKELSKEERNAELLRQIGTILGLDEVKKFTVDLTNPAVPRIQMEILQRVPVDYIEITLRPPAAPEKEE